MPAACCGRRIWACSARLARDDVPVVAPAARPAGRSPATNCCPPARGRHGCADRRCQRADARGAGRARRRHRRFPRPGARRCATRFWTRCSRRGCRRSFPAVRVSASRTSRRRWSRRHGDLAVHGIAMRPSSPTGLGRIGRSAGVPASGQSGLLPVRLRFLRRPRHSRARRASQGVAVPSNRGHAGAQDQFADRPARLRARADRRRAWSNRWRSAARRCSRRRRAPTASSSSPPTARASRAGSGSRRLALCLTRSSFSRSSIATKRSAAFAPPLDLTPRGRRSGSARRRARPRAGGRRRVAGRRPVVRSLERRRLRGGCRGHLRRGRGSRRARVRLGDEEIHTGVVPANRRSARGRRSSIATGGMVPRGADAVVMVEHADVRGRELRIARAVTAGSGVSFAGTDITAGETVLRRGQLLTSRETGVLAAIGVAAVEVWRKPIVAILSTGDEIIAPGEPMQPATVYDSNAQVLADAVRELGGEPLAARHRRATTSWRCARSCSRRSRLADIVLLSGGTSKGAGDLSYRVVAELTDPGIVAHGVALKPGKPICLAATGGRPVVVLPGFPTSAIFTFHEFVAPVLRMLAGRDAGRTHRRAGEAGREGQQRDRPDRIPAGRPGRDSTRASRRDLAGGLSDGTRVRQRHDVQPRRRLRHDRPAPGNRRGGDDRRRAVARARAAAGRPGRDRQPLRRARLPAWRAAATRRSLEVSRRRQHRRAGRGQARRVRPRRHPPARSRRPASTTGRS